MARPSPWNSPTKAIRVPEHACVACLNLARMLDQPSPEGFVQNGAPVLLTVDNDRYLLPTVTLTPEQADWADRLIDQVLATVPELGKDGEALLLAGIAPRCLSPI